MKILTIVGARPQFIKAAVVSRAIQNFNRTFSSQMNEIIVHTGQHYDSNMSDVFFSEMKIPQPQYKLKVGSGSHAHQTGQIMVKLEEVCLKEIPDLILVYGDTNSTLAGAIVAAKLYIPLAHVEAGLRSFNRQMPEEINRVLTDQISEILFCPTEEAIRNLKNEGIPSPPIRQKVIKSGDVMNDAAIFYANFSSDEWLFNNELKPKDYILATVHRAENTDNKEKLKNLILALAQISMEKSKVVWPMHPRTRKIIESAPQLQKIISESKIIATEPIGYLDMIRAEQNARLILTDSGGVQKEAFFHKIPCVTLRTETEWVELVDSGWNVLAGTKPEKIIECTNLMLTKNIEKLEYPDLYGSGKAGHNIANALFEWSKK